MLRTEGSPPGTSRCKGQAAIIVSGSSRTLRSSLGTYLLGAGQHNVLGDGLGFQVQP